MPKLEYPVIIAPLSDEDGGGFVALVPDLPGCMSDGATTEEALASVQDAITAWLDEVAATGRAVPAASRHLAGSNMAEG
jgi:antitoxin HicB